MRIKEINNQAIKITTIITKMTKIITIIMTIIIRIITILTIIIIITIYPLRGTLLRLTTKTVERCISRPFWCIYCEPTMRGSQLPPKFFQLLLLDMHLSVRSNIYTYVKISLS